MNFQKMTKKQLEAHGRKNGVELDRRKSKKDMIIELNKALAKKPVAKKPVAKKPVAKKPVAKKPVAKNPVAKKPVAKKPVAKIVEKPRPTMPSKPPTYVAPKLSFFDKVKKFFNL